MRALFFQGGYSKVTFTTHSNNAGWYITLSPDITMYYDYSGALTGHLEAKSPTIDLSANTGAGGVNFEVDGNWGIITSLSFYELSDITDINIDAAINLEYLLIYNILAPSIDLSKNTKLKRILLTGRSPIGGNFTSLDLSNNEKLERVELSRQDKMTSLTLPANNVIRSLSLNDCTSLPTTKIDDIIINLANNSVSNGYLDIINTLGRTSASDTAYNTLISRNWIIQQ